MGQFSWLDCKTRRQIRSGYWKNSYVLVPAEFGGGHIEEPCYDGYGRFGGHDIYDLVADWNKEHITEANFRTPKRESYESGKDGDFYYENAVKRYRNRVERCKVWQSGASDEEMSEKYGDDWKRCIGIDIACYDEDNAALRYPIKITHDPKAVYEKCKFSLSDPKQGWR